MTTVEMNTALEQKLFNGKNFHVFIYNKTESISGLHQHDYYEFTLVLTGRCYQEINGKRVLLVRLYPDWLLPSELLRVWRDPPAQCRHQPPLF